MRVAVLLQGDPRFCEEFDLFLNNLKGYSQVDWFMYMWENSPAPDTHGYDLVPEKWRTVNKEWALTKFQESLPAGHTVIQLTLADQHSLSFPDVPRKAGETMPHTVWRMWYSLNHADRMRQEHEKKIGVKYDLVIRTRPDVALMNEINLQVLHQHIQQNPKLVIQPANKICGYGPYICDLFAITSSDNMNIYANLYNMAKQYYDSGWMFHPETMLARHLQVQGLQVQSAGFNIEFRYLGEWKDLQTGAITQQNVGHYSSKFGRWSA
jgi:hypothetical protein